MLRETVGLPAVSAWLGGRAEKVSVSMPSELTESVRERVGRGEFSAYVAEAVAMRLEMDLLAALDQDIEERRGTPIPDEYLDEAEAAWPDDR